MKTSLRNIKKGKIFSMVLCLLLAVGMMPITSFTAFADGDSGTPQTGKRTVMMGTSALTGPVAVTTDKGKYYEPTAYVYIERLANTNVPAPGEPQRYKCFVANSGFTNSGDKDGMFLIMDGVTGGQFQYHKGVGGWNNSWADSYAKEYVSDVLQINNYGLLPVTKGESSATLFYNNLKNSALNNETVFLISAEELAAYVGNYKEAPGIAKNYSYWLRSPNPNHTDAYNVYTINTSGSMENSHVSFEYYGRLGTNIDKSKVLFTIPYNVDKPAVSDGWQEVTAYDPEDYKTFPYSKNTWGITWVVDSAEDATYGYSCQLADGQSTNVKPGDKVAFKTTQGSDQGDVFGVYKHFQSVLIKNENNEALYYGRYANGWSKDWTDHEITVPELPAGTYTFCFFAEYDTSVGYDYASKPVEIEFTIANEPQQAPKVNAVNETISGKKDGKITGVDAAMEYRKSGSSQYIGVNSTDITDLEAGTYYVRYAAKTNYDASPDTEVVIGAGKKLTVTLPADQTGYELKSSADKLDWHGSADLAFKLAEGYEKTDQFKVSATGATLTDNGDGTYTISEAEDNVVVTVEGVKIKASAPTTGNEPEDSKQPESSDSAQTGDSFNLLAIVVILIASLTALIGVLFGKRKKSA